MNAPEPIAEGRKASVDWYRNVQSSEQAKVGLILNVALSKIDPLLDCRGILVSIHGERENILFANFESTVSVQRVKAKVNFIKSHDTRLNENAIEVVEEANAKESGQKWCLS